MLEIRPTKLIKAVCPNHFNHKDVRKKMKQQLNFYLRLLKSYNPLNRKKVLKLLNSKIWTTL